jgi:dCMP deaminase
VDINKWNKRYLDMAYLVASWSKDPSSKIGAVAVSPKGQVLSTGYNGFPRNIEDSSDRLHDRELKYKYIVHAEMNAIYNATYNGVSLDGSTLYVSGLPCCNQCALGIIQVGIKRVVMEGDVTNDRWAESWALTKQLFEEAGVEWEFFND